MSRLNNTACGDASMDETLLYRQLGLPVFQNKVYQTPESARRAVIGDVALTQCPRTGLVYNALFQPALLQYDGDYQNEQACSASFRDHLEQVLRIILRNVAANEAGVEIGCGKGYFLEMLAGAGANVVGYDPAYEGSNKRVFKKYLGATEADEIPDYLILRHVLEHIPSPWSFLNQLVARCKAGAKIYIEVPCFEWIVSNNAFYDVFYEHVNYFTLNVLKSAFSRIIECGTLFGGQYIYIVADLASFQSPCEYRERLLAPLAMDENLNALLSLRNSQSGDMFVWGAGAKGITFSNIVSRQGIRVSGLVDINPAKQGRYAGLSAIPIVAPAEVLPRLKGADVFVMNPVYLSEIKAMSREEKRINWISVTS